MTTTNLPLWDRLQEALKSICARVAAQRGTPVEADAPLVDVGIVLGSGLGALAGEVQDAVRIPYTDIPHFPPSTVAGHAGALVVGTLEGKRVAVFQGRVHYYEGYPMQDVTFLTRLMWVLGARTMLVTNAVGGINEDYRVGDLICIKDHINYMGTNPLLGPNDERFGPRFPPMDDAYNLELRELAHGLARRLDVPFKDGVYLALSGPSYETKAEIEFFRRIGADTVGMSTAPEVIVARHCGMRVLGISCITNLVHGSHKETSHEDVLKSANEAGPRFIRLMKAIVSEMALTPRVEEPAAR